MCVYGLPMGSPLTYRKVECKGAVYMTRALAIIRRVLLACTITLLVCVCLCKVSFSLMYRTAVAHDNVTGVFCIIFLLSPILYVISTLASVIYIRAEGQFSEVHQEQPFLFTVIRCFVHDLISPFKNILNFISALFNKEAIGREVLIIRFFELVAIVIFCIIGLHLINKNLDGELIITIKRHYSEIRELLHKIAEDEA